MNALLQSFALVIGVWLIVSGDPSNPEYGAYYFPSGSGVSGAVVPTYGVVHESILGSRASYETCSSSSEVGDISCSRYSSKGGFGLLVGSLAWCATIASLSQIKPERASAPTHQEEPIDAVGRQVRCSLPTSDMLVSSVSPSLPRVGLNKFAVDRTKCCFTVSLALCSPCQQVRGPLKARVKSMPGSINACVLGLLKPNAVVQIFETKTIQRKEWMRISPRDEWICADDLENITDEAKEGDSDRAEHNEKIKSKGGKQKGTKGKQSDGKGSKKSEKSAKKKPKKQEKEFKEGDSDRAKRGRKKKGKGGKEKGTRGQQNDKGGNKSGKVGKKKRREQQEKELAGTPFGTKAKTQKYGLPTVPELGAGAFGLTVGTRAIVSKKTDLLKAIKRAQFPYAREIRESERSRDGGEGS